MFANRSMNLARAASRLKQQSGSLVGRPTAAPMSHVGSLGSYRSYADSPPMQLPISDRSRSGFHSASQANKASVSVNVNDVGHHPDGKDEKASSSSTSSSPNPAKNPLPDFDDAKAAYAAKSNFELYRSALTYTVCQLSFLVKHAETLLGFSRKTLGDGITDSLLKVSLFGHFCAGVDLKDIRPAIQTLEKHGIGSILDFAAEDDGESQKQPKPNTIEDKLQADTLPHPETEARKRLKVRVYDYTSEAQCDQHLEHFRRCIQDVAALGPDGYAAVKITALGSPELLKRMSTAIVEAKNLFAKFDDNGDGLITEEEFEQGYRMYFDANEGTIKELKEQLRCPKTGRFDYITWSMTLSPRDLPRITRACREQGPLSMAAPTEEELELIENMYNRGYALAEEAAKYGTRLLIDAEQVRFQPAIDNLVLDLQQKYNSTETSDIPLIYNTYQCYLKDALDRLMIDVERSERFDFNFGAKLVRGAYMESERYLAKERGYPSPIHENILDTHDCYNQAVDFLLNHASKESTNKTELMLATHNRESIEKAIESMNKHGISRRATTTAFGQLYGMADNLSFNLGKHGYRAYKYVPYGEVKMVMPYLIRRANENSSISKGAQQELSMLFTELKRRRFGFAS
uniref:Proline dehydrogenase n=1 Tax=Amphora coffeiformis TaxID=265554 RepID=A0A7S3L645_9STRA|mmetsp:Transcript_11399/g.21767  ORF Transcript_11399/g.21767 Transcript_11399/m.21767 type:complete len:631 (-) Transcript_11399:86-1978(-)